MNTFVHEICIWILIFNLLFLFNSIRCVLFKLKRIYLIIPLKVHHYSLHSHAIILSYWLFHKICNIITIFLITSPTKIVCPKTILHRKISPHAIPLNMLWLEIKYLAWVRLFHSCFTCLRCLKHCSNISVQIYTYVICKLYSKYNCHTFSKLYKMCIAIIYNNV